MYDRYRTDAELTIWLILCLWTVNLGDKFLNSMNIVQTWSCMASTWKLLIIATFFQFGGIYNRRFFLFLFLPYVNEDHTPTIWGRVNILLPGINVFFNYRNESYYDGNRYNLDNNFYAFYHLIYHSHLIFIQNRNGLLRFSGKKQFRQSGSEDPHLAKCMLYVGLPQTHVWETIHGCILRRSFMFGRNKYKPFAGLQQRPGK